MHLPRLMAPIAGVVLFLSAGLSGAATLSVDIPGCSQVQLSGTGPSYTITCAQQAQTCVAQATPANPAGGATVTLSAACTPAATSVSWQASRDCTTPTAASATTATVVEAGGRSCVYTATANGGGSGAASVVWGVGGGGGANAPTGCSIARTPANGALGASGGAISMQGSCTGGGAVTSWQWRKNAQSGWSAAQAPTDTLPANTGAAQVTYTYGLTACAGASCAAEVVTSFTVAGAVAAGFCGQYSDVVTTDLPWPGTIDTANAGGVRPETMYVVRFTVPAGATASQPGLLRAVEFMGEPANRVMSLSTQPCDFRGYTAGSFGAVDPTGATAPLFWSSDQTPNMSIRLTSMTGPAPKLTPGQTYYANIRTISFFSGTTSCTQSTCDMRVSLTAPF